MLTSIFLSATDGSGRFALYREIGAYLVGVGVVCAGLVVLKKLITNQERRKEAVSTYHMAIFGCCRLDTYKVADAS